MENADIVVEDFVVEAGDGRLAARWIRPVESPDRLPTMVFLHEGLGSIESWRSFPQTLVRATGLPALVFDRRGYGRSGPGWEPWGRDYLHRFALDELPAVLDVCSVESPLLVGHSDGGSVALLFAAHHSAVAVVALAAHVFVEQEAREGIRRTVALWQGGDLESRLRRVHGVKTASVFWHWADTWLAPWFDDWNIADELAGIQCPVLLLQGDRDEYATPDHLEAIATGVSGSVRRVLLPDCGHAPHLQSRSAVSKEIEAFVASVR